MERRKMVDGRMGRISYRKGRKIVERSVADP
jgi:hypothetical protein